MRISELPTEFRGCSWDEGWEFDAPCVVYYPKEFRTYKHVGSIGEVEAMVEEICCNIALGGKRNDGDLERECKWRGWNIKGFGRRKRAWHTVIKVEWYQGKDYPEWRIVSIIEQFGILGKGGAR